MHVSLQHSDVDIKTHRETSEVSGANLESRVRHKVRGRGINAPRSMRYQGMDPRPYCPV
jgi:hypothetical protein